MYKGDVSLFIQGLILQFSFRPNIRNTLQSHRHSNWLHFHVHRRPMLPHSLIIETVNRFLEWTQNNNQRSGKLQILLILVFSSYLYYVCRCKNRESFSDELLEFSYKFLINLLYETCKGVFFFVLPLFECFFTIFVF